MDNIGLDRIQTDPNFDFKHNLVDNLENNTPYESIGHNCSYYEQDEFNDKTKNISSSFSTYSHNVRSLTGKWNEFSELIISLNKDNFKFSIVAIQELWNVPPGTEYKIPGYKPLQYKIRDMTGLNPNSGGGVGLFIDDKLESETIDDLSVFEIGIFESQFVKVNIAKNKFMILGNIYRPNTAPLADIVKFNQILESILDKIKNDPVLSNSEDIQIVGDVNIDLLQHQQHSHTMEYLDTLLSHHMLPLITLPTRITNTSATIIDHISSSQQTDVYDASIIHCSLFDHLPIFYIKNIQTNIPPPKYIKSRKINSTTIPSFENLLKTVPWDNITSENRPKQAFEKFFNILDEAVNLSFPEVVTKVKPNDTPLNPWMSQGLLISRKHKEKLFSKKLRKPTDININNFKKYNTVYKKLIREAKKLYYSNKFKEYSKDARKTWITIRSIVGGKKHRESIPEYFKHNNKILSDSMEIAEGFNKFFSGIGPELASSIQKSNKNFQDYLGPQTLRILSLPGSLQTYLKR